MKHSIKRRKPLVICCLFLCLTVMELARTVPARAQDTSASTDGLVLAEDEKLDRLQSLGLLIEAKRTQRDELTAALEGSAPDAMQDERARLNTVTQDLASLRTSFERTLLPNLDIELMSDNKNSKPDWRAELLSVLEPLLNSLRSMTERPRQLTELRRIIDLSTQKLAIAEDALRTINQVSQRPLNNAATARLDATREKWIDARNVINQSLQISTLQFERLQSSQSLSASGLITGVQGFFTGRGLTLALAILAGTGVSVLMKVCWHLFNTRLVKKSIRRKAMWYRLMAYSYHLSTILVVIVVVLYILYLRQDVLLMGLAFLAVAAAMISLRTFLPRFLIELRLLLNLGAVREDECVIHNGLPWQVMSLNIFTVLRNPALEGIVRLPLNVMTSCVSRPVVRGELWFPTRQHDYILLPDNTLGQVISQTPDLVKLSVKGGMYMAIPTADFYRMKVINLSSDGTFAVTTRFSLDHGLRSMSLKVIPEILKIGVLARLKAAGYESGSDVISVQAELHTAGVACLDFQIVVSMNSKRAADYFAIERLIQQACVGVANKQQWLIPFPQLTLYNDSPNRENTPGLRRVA